MENWYSMESAPKDGTAIWVIGKDFTHSWDYKGPARYTGDYWLKLHRPGFINMIVYPTAWKPL